MTTETQTETETVTRTGPPRLRVLVVDREKEIRDILLPWLFDEGFDCREAGDGQEAIDLLATGLRIDLVTSCLLMPNVDGYSLLLYVKKHHPRIPFVLVTAIHDAEVREHTLKNGADGYLLKPFTREEFVTFVRRALATSPKRASQHTGSR